MCLARTREVPHQPERVAHVVGNDLILPPFTYFCQFVKLPSFNLLLCAPVDHPGPPRRRPAQSIKTGRSFHAQHADNGHPVYNLYIVLYVLAMSLIDRTSLVTNLPTPGPQCHLHVVWMVEIWILPLRWVLCSRVPW